MQRLKDLSYLPSYIGRARYFRGHGVHSPYIYAIVRQVFMRRGLYDESCALYTELVERGVAKRRAEELTNLV